jgi:hypothetical protein
MASVRMHFVIKLPMSNGVVTNVVELVSVIVSDCQSPGRARKLRARRV